MAPGDHLGPYGIVAPLGVGGMGEVYRARDPRLRREVAIKVLPRAFSANTEWLCRFEQEARAAAALSHPNILAIHDLGTEDGVPYVVTELLEGATFRGRLEAGPFPSPQVVGYAVQIARGLAAAHRKGIVHRDIKPENLFLTSDRRVKILDFGLAKLTLPEGREAGVAPTMSAFTAPGAILGTVSYMSPEQVRGQPADHRSDIFSFGVVLYEMLSGTRAFARDSAVETMSAILSEAPPDLSANVRDLPPALAQIVSHCLEKDPDDRFQSTSDLAFDLEALSGVSLPAITPASAVPSRRRRWRAVAAAALLAAGIVGAFWAGRHFVRAPLPAFRQLTFHQGTVLSARFARGGSTIVYGAAWEGRPAEVFEVRLGSSESRSLGLSPASLLAISAAGELAVLLEPRYSGAFAGRGTLARASLAGGIPRKLVRDVEWADWSPDGKELAIVRALGGKRRLEYPVGRVLYETAGHISRPRLSPDGTRIAFLDHPLPNDDRAVVAVVDLAGQRTALSREWNSTRGLAWSPRGDEILFAAAETGGARALYALTLSGQQRLVTQIAGALTLHDVSQGGRVLVARDSTRCGIIALGPGDTKERDLSWLDWSLVTDLSEDGKHILINESGLGAGPVYATYLRRMDGSPAVRLGEGLGTALSPDGKWVVAIVGSPATQLVLWPIGAGQTQTLPRGRIENYVYAKWFPSGRRVLFAGNEPGTGMRLYLQDIAGGNARAITSAGPDVSYFAISPDERRVVAGGPGGSPSLFATEGGASRALPGALPGDLPIRWSADARWLFVFSMHGDLPTQVHRVEVDTGRRELWKELIPSDPAGVVGITTVWLTPDGKSYAYSYTRVRSDLYVAEGLR